MFEYRLDGSYYTVVGLTEKGRNAEELIIPYQVDGIYVKAFLPLVFSIIKISKALRCRKIFIPFPTEVFWAAII